MFNSYPAISLTPDLWASQLPSQSFDKAPRERGGLVLAPHQIGYLPKMLERNRWHIGVKMVFGNGHLYLSDDLELSRADNFSVQNIPRAMSRLLQLARICQEPLDLSASRQGNTSITGGASVSLQMLGWNWSCLETFWIGLEGKPFISTIHAEWHYALATAPMEAAGSQPCNHGKWCCHSGIEHA